MKKIVLIVPALMALAAVSCTKSEVLESNSGEIRFNVVANKATKAADVFCNSNMPGAFKVYAVNGGKTYIEGDDIVKKGENSWENQSGVRYWPETEVDFYAHVNAGNAFIWSESSAPTVENFTPSATVADQVDLLYAVKTKQSKMDTPVELNFRHALSQIVFNAKNTNANLYVEITGVKVANVGRSNTFTYPETDTDSKFVSHDGTGTLPSTGAGSWAELTSGDASYEVDFKAVPVVGNNKPVDLTTANDSGKEFNSQAMLLLPQTTTAWVPSKDSNTPSENNTGSYFLIDCAIWNVADGTAVDKDTDVQLWGEGGNTKELSIPVAFTWEQGKKYIYTLVFGQGNGGYDPDPDPDDPDPKPVLVPIDFTVSVDDFQVEDPIEVESGLPTTGA